MAARKRIDWRRAAEELAGLLPRKRLHPAVLKWAEKSPTRERWAVAFSGGADSLALLLLLWAHWPERREGLCALHFNHRLRGGAANADEAFCARVAQALGVEWRTERWREARKDASEAEARAARFSFFEAQLKVLRAKALWLGHQQDDVAETMLMRLARGSGAAGLAAPRPVQWIGTKRVHLRALLNLQKREIESALRSVGGRWREDLTNAGADFFRNRIRRDVMPAWCAAATGRDALAGAALARERLEEDDEALERWLGEVSPMLANGALSLSRLKGKPRALVRRALLGWLVNENLAGVLSRAGFEALLDDLMEARRTRHSVGHAGFAVIDSRQLRRVAARTKKGG